MDFSNGSLVMGHQKVLEMLKTLYYQGNLAPAWLLVGQRGIGKATLAYHLAREVLAVNPQNPTGLSAALVDRQITAGSYPNFLVIERPENADGERVNEIPVDEARKTLDFLYQSPAIPGWRVVIVDAADELNRAASNSLLKVLEEPPAKTLFLLVCHSLGQVLPTIRSRCQKVNLEPLSIADLGHLSIEEDIFEYAQGSLGLYDSLLKAGGADFTRKLAKAIEAARGGQTAAAQRFCDDVSKDKTQYSCFLWLIEQYAYKAVLAAKGPEQAHWVKVFESLTAFLKGAKTTHLDKSQLMLSCFLIIENPSIYT